MGKPKPRFFEAKCRELEDRADELSRACDLALMTVREAKGNCQRPDVKDQMRRSLMEAVEAIQASKAELVTLVSD